MLIYIFILIDPSCAHSKSEKLKSQWVAVLVMYSPSKEVHNKTFCNEPQVPSSIIININLNDEILLKIIN